MENDYPELTYEPTDPESGEFYPLFNNYFSYRVKPKWTEGCESTAEAGIYWDEQKKEWLADVNGEYLESQWDQETGGILYLPFRHGPFKLNNSACIKLLAAYKLDADKVDLSKISKMEPSLLEKLASEK